LCARPRQAATGATGSAGAVASRVAKIYPSDWKALAATGWLARQTDTLRLLEAGLSARYAVYHGVHWTRLAQGSAILGSIDFVVVGPSGRICLIEQKTGLLRETDQGLASPAKPGLVAVGMARAREGLRQRLVLAFGDDAPNIEEVLYCPDYVVRDGAIAGVNPERIIDATRRGELVALLQRVLPASEPASLVNARLHRFFSDLLELVPDTTGLRERAAEWVTRLSAGLATWARAIRMHPHRLRVIGTAGSGKTQLALRVLEDASSQNKRALYVCFNRPLADHIARIAPASTRVLTYHQLCEERARQAGLAIDYSASDRFARLERQFASIASAPEVLFDVLVIDEGQDFAREWVAPLFREARPDAAIWWLEDPLQNLYGREAIALEGFVALSAPVNFRSPRELVALLARLLPEAAPMAGSPFEGAGITLLRYRSSEELKEETKRAITQALQAGFARSEIAVLTFHGREHSKLLGLDFLGPHRLRRYTGSYDLIGNPLYSEGEVLLESIFRFKGQAAPCVILTEIDCLTLDSSAKQRLFVGATRATMKLVLIASEAAAELVRPHLEIEGEMEAGSHVP